MTNLARELLRSRGETVEDWDGLCSSLADEIVGDGDIIYVEPVKGFLLESKHGWIFHQVAFINEMIHDAWCDDDALPLSEWLVKMFGSTPVEVSLNGKTIYVGPADRYVKGTIIEAELLYEN